MTHCIFCKIIAGALPCYKVYEDQDVLAFLDIIPLQSGHTLVVSKQHIDSPFDMDDASYAKYLVAAKRLITPIRRAMGSVKVALVIEGLEVPHAHIKLIPISGPGDIDHTNARQASAEELKIIAEKICQEIK